MRPATPSRLSRPLSASGLAESRRNNPLEPPAKDANHYKNLLEKRLQAVIAETKALEEKTAECYVNLARETDFIEETKVAEGHIEMLRQELYDINESIERMRSRSKKDTSGNEDILRSELIKTKNECERLLSAKHEISIQLEAKRTEKQRLDRDLQTKLKNDKKEFDTINSDMLHMNSEISKNRKLLESLRRDIRTSEAIIKANPNIGKRIDCEVKLEKLQSENKQLESDLQLYSKPMEEQKDLILQYVKDMNAENLEIENVLTKLSAEISRNERTMSEMKSGNKDRDDKYQYLSTKRAEIEEYITSLREDNKNLETLISSRQTEIVSTASQVKEIRLREKEKPEVDMLSDDINNSRITYDRLRAELLARRAELKRLDDIDSVYIQRSAELNEKIKLIHEELHTLGDSTVDLEGGDNLLQTLASEIQAIQNRITSEKFRLDGKLSELASIKAEAIDGTPFGELLDIGSRLRDIEIAMETTTSRLHEETFQLERRQIADSIRTLNSLILASIQK